MAFSVSADWHLLSSVFVHLVLDVFWFVETCTVACRLVASKVACGLRADAAVNIYGFVLRPGAPDSSAWDALRRVRPWLRQTWSTLQESMPAPLPAVAATLCVLAQRPGHTSCSQ